ncbi:centromere protein J [Selaginella moellendorffii]|uniref:centromere protein J n=1 Tax=Selaginella moellendorffii TaxID=88036 RepID=UPI000D1C62EB|nr:centromere protein J [Selaginella moellendorffii]|eukprot:XP_024537777.1 centromere protein J [Selaginella moellendorffii]
MDGRSSPSSSPWAPVICSSPLHSGGLSMENPFEMFDEVGRSLKWFSLSRNAPDAPVVHRPVLEEVSSQDSYDSDCSSTSSWNKNPESLAMPDEHCEEQESSVSEPLRCRDELVIHHKSPEPKIEEIYDEPCVKEDIETEDRYYKDEHVQESKRESCLYSQMPPPVESDKDPVSGLVRSFFRTKLDARKVPDVISHDKIPDTEALEKKLEVLEAENLRVKKESQRLIKLLKEKEDDCARFTQDKAAWEKQSVSSIQAFCSEKEELLKELKREKRLLEKRFQAMSQLPNSLPNKSERKEIADLKAKLIDVHEEHLKKEARLRLTNIRLRKLVKEMSARLNEKKEEIKRYERLLQDWDVQEEKEKLEKSEIVPGCKTIKKIECLSSERAAVGCRITGALFYQRPDGRAKQKKEGASKDSSIPACGNKIKAASNPSTTEKTCTSIVDVSSDAVDSASDKNRATSICKEKSSSEPGTEDGASMDGTVVDELITDHESGSDVLFEDKTRSKENTCRENGIRGAQRRSLVFTDGTREEEYQDGLACLYFPNGDIKNSLADGTTEYYYSEIDTWHTTKPDGVEIFYFPHNQIEEHWPDGHKRIIFPDGTSTVES